MYLTVILRFCTTHTICTICTEMESISLPDNRWYKPLFNDAFFSKSLPRSTFADDQIVVDLGAECMKDRWHPLEVQRNAETLVLRRQKSELWLKERWGKVTGSKISKFLGWIFGRGGNAEILACIFNARDDLLRERKSAYDSAVSGLKFTSDRDEAVGRERMQWGNDHEDDALATLLYYHPAMCLRECVLQGLDEGRAQKKLCGGDGESTSNTGASVQFGDSQDGAGYFLHNKKPISVELKAAYGNRAPMCYTSWKAYYVGQCLLHMEVEDSDVCYAVCWTPTETRGWRLPRNKKLWGEIKAFIDSVVSKDKLGKDPTWVLRRSSELRKRCEHVAYYMIEMDGSPFASCFAKRAEVA